MSPGWGHYHFPSGYYIITTVNALKHVSIVYRCGTPILDTNLVQVIVTRNPHPCVNFIS